MFKWYLIELFSTYFYFTFYIFGFVLISFFKNYFLIYLVFIINLEQNYFKAFILFLQFFFHVKYALQIIMNMRKK